MEDGTRIRFFKDSHVGIIPYVSCFPCGMSLLILRNVGRQICGRLWQREVEGVGMLISLDLLMIRR